MKASPRHSQAWLITGLITAALSFSAPAQAQTTPEQNSEAAAAPLGSDLQWNICNETSYVLRVATATQKAGAITPRGWDRVRPGACITQTPPPQSPRYVFAESERFHMGRLREWKGEVKFCVSDINFEADAAVSCALQDMQSRAYLQVDPSESTTTFIEPDNFTDNAETAGIQRLLQDNGYKISRIDGLPGRRTSRTLKAFLKDKDLEGSLSAGQKFDALVEGAQAVQDSIGLTLCNQTQGRVWTAIATQQEGEWESRGWWPIEIGKCERPFTSSLEGTNAHFFTLQEQAPDEETGLAPRDKLLRTVAAKPRQFCVSEGVFSALGDEYCTDRGYSPVNFRPLPTDGVGTKVTLTDADFINPSSTGLRR